MDTGVLLKPPQRWMSSSQSGCSLELQWLSLSLGFFDKTAKVFLLKERLLIKEKSYRGCRDGVIPFSWHPSNPDPFVTGYGDEAIPVWDMRTTNAPTLNFKENINICRSPIGDTIAIGIKDDVATFTDAKTYDSKAETLSLKSTIFLER